jgi:hypothetical protein
MWATDGWQKMTALLLAMASAWGWAAVGIALWWEGRQEPWMTAPASGLSQIVGMAKSWAILVTVVVLPGLLSLLRRAPRSSGLSHLRGSSGSDRG